MKRAPLLLLIVILGLVVSGCGSARVVLPEETLRVLATFVAEYNVPGIIVEIPPISQATAAPAMEGILEADTSSVLPTDENYVGTESATLEDTPIAPANTATGVGVATTTNATPTSLPTATFTALPSNVLPTATPIVLPSSTPRPVATATTFLPTNTSTSAPPSSTPVADSGSCMPAGNGSFESQVIALINQERSAAGLPALKANTKLTSAARGHSQDMACNGFFSHQSSTTGGPADRISAAGYSFSWAGENIAAGYGSAADTVAGWMDSPGHRANILSSNFTEIGLGYAYWAGSSFGSYITAVFGAP